MDADIRADTRRASPVVQSDREYQLLQERLDRYVTGAPNSPTFLKILRLLFSPEEAELVRHLPSRPTPIDVLAANVGMSENELRDTLVEMARRGVVLDIEHDGQSHFSLPPVVIGFYEFTFMRVRNDVPQAELARLFDLYLHEDEQFVHAVFDGQTQIGRTMVHEDALPEDDHSEILDFERATSVIQAASAVGVSQCVCRHTAEHLGRACDRPQRCCLSLNYAADTLIRSGNAEKIHAREALRILRECQDRGMVQTGDNVRRKLTYICNCCGCCCGMIEAVKDFNLRAAIVTSNWIMQVEPTACSGCGKCVEACPFGAIEVVEMSEPSNDSNKPSNEPNKPSNDSNKHPKRAVCDDQLCLGCGVCHRACSFGGIQLKPRPQRVYTPETLFDRIVSMAVERRKLADLIFDDPTRLSHRALGRIFRILERSPVWKTVLAIQPLKSTFIRGLVAGAKRSSGEFRQLLE